eukprot:1157826-Pelagomonas_calceolata.AAC.9
MEDKCTLNRILLFISAMFGDACHLEKLQIGAQSMQCRSTIQLTSKLILHREVCIPAAWLTVASGVNTIS